MLRHTPALRKSFILTVATATAAAACVAVSAAPHAGAAVPHPVTHASHLRPAAPKMHHAPVGVSRSRRAAAKPHPLTAAQRLSQALQAQRGAGSTAEVTLRGSSTTSLRNAVGATGGRVVGAVPGAITAVVAKSKVSTLQHTPGVSSVRAPRRLWEQSGPTSEGVTASGANAWQTSGATGDSGAGVTIGIVDGGFADLATAVTNHDLPDGTTVSSDDDHCMNVNGDDHGTAVAEIVHQMAPGATLKLYCVDDTDGLNTVANQIVADGSVSIVNCSLGLVGDSRGDGTAPAGSAAAAVATVRKAGVLWVNSAGNDAADHWSGTFADADKDGFADLDTPDNEDDAVYVPGTDQVDGGGTADLVLRWDQWPTSSAPISVDLYQAACTDDECNDTGAFSGPVTYKQTDATPVIDIPVSNDNALPQDYDIEVRLGTGFPKVRYDLNYEGVVSESYLAGRDPAHAASGSMDQPADSPFAFSVGAADVGADGEARGTLEDYSSRGPTIDARTKPDITGWDGVSSPEYGAPSADGTGGFYGTSASSPHVTGAAALVKAANPGLDAAQIQNFLEQRASASTTSATPLNPPTNALGHGLLTLGATPASTPVSEPAGSGYTALPATTRVLDTRTTNGGHKGKLGTGGVVKVTIPSLPGDATAVAINLTGVGATGNTFLSAYPTTYGATSNLNLSKTDPTAAVFAVVTVKNKTFYIRNNYATIDVVVDEVGYFGTGSESGRYTALSAADRVLDTRTTVGGHHAPLQKYGTVSVDPGLDQTATAAVVNITTTDTTNGFITAAPTCSLATSTLNYINQTRANLAVVGLSSGHFCIEAASKVDVIVDVVGYIGTSGAKYVALPAPYRIVDTRTGNGGNANGASPRALGANSTAAFYGGNVRDVPASASALLTGVLEASNTAGGYLSTFPGATRPSGASSSVNFSPGRLVPNASIVGLSDDHQFGVFNRSGSTQVVVDLFGYFRPDPAG